MTKFFIYATAAVMVAFGVHAQTTNPPCAAVDFTTKTTDIKSLNAVIDIAINSGLLKTSIPDPIVVSDVNVSVVPFKLLNLNFNMTPHITSISLGGVPTILPQHLNVSSADSVTLAADFNGTVTLDATFKVSIQQLDLKWYSICWTSLLHPVTCPPLEIDVNVTLAMVKPTLVADMQLDMVGCATGVSTTVCKDVTVTDILVAALSNAFESLLARLLRRFTNVQMLDIQIGWDSITQLDIIFTNSSTFLNAIVNALVDFTVSNVNKKGDAYTTVVDVLQKVIKSLVNKVLSTSLAAQFGMTCYDA
ncbi:hypothetical protein FI667_g12154, partial [Globisporangium splendens]